MGKILTQTLGYPRIGTDRELKKALEAHWKGKVSTNELLETFRAVQQQSAEAQLAAKIDRIGVGDATLYDHVLDWTVRLGQGRTQMETTGRLIRFRAEDGRVYDYITNRFDLSPLTIAQLYEARWAIEKFFKWLKRTLRMERSLGRSAVAYEIHVLMTLIVDILLKILVGLPPRADHVSVNVLRIISEYLFVRISKTLKQAIAEATESSLC